MYAILKGMGYSGVHIGGHNIRYEQVEEIIRQGEALVPRWTDLIRYFHYPIDNGFYFLKPDPATGLNKDMATDRQSRPPDAKVGWMYGFSRFFHRLMYEPGKNLYGAMKALCKTVQGTRLEGIFHKLEHLTKVALFDCRDCGDCALPDAAYLCPMSQCPKNQRNGPCGGSFQGWCEVHPGKKQCIYVRAYARLKNTGRNRVWPGTSCRPNWDLYQTSSWINYYLGKDHTSQNQK